MVGVRVGARLPLPPPPPTKIIQYFVSLLATFSTCGGLFCYVFLLMGDFSSPRGGLFATFLIHVGVFSGIPLPTKISAFVHVDIDRSLFPSYHKETSILIVFIGLTLTIWQITRGNSDNNVSNCIIELFITHS